MIGGSQTFRTHSRKLVQAHRLVTTVRPQTADVEAIPDRLHRRVQPLLSPLFPHLKHRPAWLTSHLLDQNFPHGETRCAVGQVWRAQMSVQIAAIVGEAKKAAEVYDVIDR